MKHWIHAIVLGMGLIAVATQARAEDPRTEQEVILYMRSLEADVKTLEEQRRRAPCECKTMEIERQLDAAKLRLGKEEDRLMPRRSELMVVAAGVLATGLVMLTTSGAFTIGAHGEGGVKNVPLFLGGTLISLSSIPFFILGPRRHVEVPKG